MRLAELWTYPVKSCIGISAETREVDEYGLAGDREFVVATEGGKLLTQRNAPKLNLLHASRRDGYLCLSAQNMPPLAVDIARAGKVTQVKLYDGFAPGLCMGEEAAQWLLEFLGRPCRLVRSHERFARRMPVEAAHLFLPWQRRYPDCAPIHLISRASLDALNRRLAAPVEMSRFRPNLVVEGVGPFEEDRLRSIRIGDIALEYMGLAERCVIPTIAPATAARSAEPLRTLRGFRHLADGFYTRLAFGTYFRPIQVGVLRVGDGIEVLAVGQAPELRSH